MEWFLYIVKCSDSSLYTGITNNLEKRISKHNSKKGAASLMGKLPVVLVYQEIHPNRSSASKREAQIKKLNRSEKLELIKNSNLVTKVS